MGRKATDLDLSWPENKPFGASCPECEEKFWKMPSMRCPHWQYCQKGILMCVKCKKLIKYTGGWSLNANNHMTACDEEVTVPDPSHLITLTLRCLCRETIFGLTKNGSRRTWHERDMRFASLVRCR